jgi:hypothetical protein
MVPLATLLVALGVSPSGNSEPERVTTALSVERLPLAAPLDRVALSVDSLAMRMELTSTTHARAIAQRLLASKPQLCPLVMRLGNTVVLDCRTPRIEARLDPGGGKPVLEIREVRGLPTDQDSDQLWFFYHPISLRLGRGCPGDTPAAKGECLFTAGRFTEAALQFRKALHGENLRFAQLRLGDIALRTGDPATAAGWYRMAVHYGAFGRMARARLCELGGTCLGEQRKRVFDASLLPEPLHSEMRLRGARAAAYVGAVKEAMTSLLDLMRDNPHLCDTYTRSLCRRLVLFALRFPDRDGASESLEAYLNLPSRTDGFLCIELVRAAAERALDLGAPFFGANLLAASLPWVEAADADATGDLLLRSAEMYLVANDPARARILFDYVDGRIGRKRMTGPRWAAVIAAVADIDVHAQSLQGQAIDRAARDVAEAYTAVSRSLRLRQGQNLSNDSESP